MYLIKKSEHQEQAKQLERIYSISKIVGRLFSPIIFLLSIISHACALLDFRLPDYVRDIDEKAKRTSPDSDFEKELSERSAITKMYPELEIPPIFVLGEWGSGKTFQLLSYRNATAKTGEHIEYCSFWGIQSVKEGLLHTIPAMQRLYIFLFGLLFLLLAYLLSPTIFSAFLSVPQIIKYFLPAIIFLIFSLVLIPNKWKIIYTVAAALSTPLCGVRRIIIDDLERSGLDNNEQWRVLLSLWKFNIQYIIPVGHGAKTSMHEWRSVATKLNGKSVRLHASSLVKLTMLRDNLGPGPFIKGDGWIEYLTPRDINAILDQWYFLIDEQPGLIKWSIVLKLILDKLMDKFEVTHEEKPQILIQDYGSVMGGFQITTADGVFDLPRRSIIRTTMSAVIQGLEHNFHEEFRKHTGTDHCFAKNMIQATPEIIAQTKIKA